jgi:hypothetical protein
MNKKYRKFKLNLSQRKVFLMALNHVLDKKKAKIAWSTISSIFGSTLNDQEKSSLRKYLFEAWLKPKNDSVKGWWYDRCCIMKIYAYLPEEQERLGRWIYCVVDRGASSKILDDFLNERILYDLNLC